MEGKFQVINRIEIVQIESVFLRFIRLKRIELESVYD